MQKKLNWKAYTDKGKNEIIGEIKERIHTHDGYILNFMPFSDLGLSLSIGIPENCILALHKALSAILDISEITHEELPRKPSEKEWMIFMNISFASGKGNVKMDVPEVPG